MEVCRRIIIPGTYPHLMLLLRRLFGSMLRTCLIMDFRPRVIVRSCSRPGIVQWNHIRVPHSGMLSPGVAGVMRGSRVCWVVTGMLKG